MLRGLLTASILKPSPLIENESSCVVADINILWLALLKEENFSMGICIGLISRVCPEMNALQSFILSFMKGQAKAIEVSSRACDNIWRISSDLSIQVQ